MSQEPRVESGCPGYLLMTTTWVCTVHTDTNNSSQTRNTLVLQLVSINQPLSTVGFPLLISHAKLNDSGC